ncbi:MAG: hypothetical protein HY941_13245 [Gammaproteobacteria bacterium]|nr:hypothetical protein [Gammaproteobacteria bacterium]
MCIKIGDSEFSTVKALMTMSLNSILADVFAVDIDAIELSTHLRNDLAMSEEKQAELGELIADYFDGLHIDFGAIATVNDLCTLVVEQEFKAIPATAF